MKKYLVTVSAVARHNEFIENEYYVKTICGSSYAMIHAISEFKKDLDYEFYGDWEILNARIRECPEVEDEDD